jgi:hypothetical protein
MKTRFAFCALLSFVAVVGTTEPSFAAEPTAADAESALQLYKDGKALRERGDVDGAIEKLRAAYALVATPITALELARTYVLRGKLVEARALVLAVPRIPVRRNESQKAVEARADSDKLAAELKPRLASITIRLEPPTKTPPPVTVDGVTVPSEAVLTPRVVNPGAHVIAIVENGAATSTADVKLGEGEAKEVALKVPPRPAETTAPAASTTTTIEAPKSRSPLVYIGFGGAIAGLAVGSVTGIMTLSKASDLESTCDADGRCPPTSQGDIDASKTTGTIATIGFIVAGVGIAVAVVGLMIGGGKAEKAATFLLRGGTVAF